MSSRSVSPNPPTAVWPQMRLSRLRPRLRALPSPLTVETYGQWSPREDPKPFCRVAPIVDAHGKSSYGVDTANFADSCYIAKPSEAVEAGPVLTAQTLERLRAVMSTLGSVWWFSGGESGAARALAAEGGKLEFTLCLWELAASAWRTHPADGDHFQVRAAFARAIHSAKLSAISESRRALDSLGAGVYQTRLFREFFRLVKENSLKLRAVLRRTASECEDALKACHSSNVRTAVELAERHEIDSARLRIAETRALRPLAPLSSMPSSSPRDSPVSSSSSFKSLQTQRFFPPQMSPLTVSGGRSNLIWRGGGGGAGAMNSSPVSVSRSPSPEAWSVLSSRDTEDDQSSTLLFEEVAKTRSEILAGPRSFASRIPKSDTDLDESRMMGEHFAQQQRVRPIPRAAQGNECIQHIVDSLEATTSIYSLASLTTLRPYEALNDDCASTWRTLASPQNGRLAVGRYAASGGHHLSLSPIENPTQRLRKSFIGDSRLDALLSPKDKLATRVA